MNDDESRTNICALFFVKKGYPLVPLVSVLQGGLAAALMLGSIEGKDKGISASSSWWTTTHSYPSSLENYHASASERAQKSL